MGRNESMAELLMKNWEEITENRDLPNKKNGFYWLTFVKPVTNSKFEGC